jgi:membrane-bound lytic murein transglycosylase B
VEPAGIGRDGAQRSGRAGKQPRHASTRARTPRGHRTRRWLLAAVSVVALTGFMAPSPQAAEMTAVGHVAETSLPWDVASGFALPALSAGAPASAITLTSEPARARTPQPATPQVISGLAANGIPNVALNAYRVAAARMAAVMPACGIDWSLLAGIGRVESNHGRFGGAVLNVDGTSTPKILGPPLDGVQFAYIADSDGGSYDGDSRFDRAVGPMQFIPTTWRAYAIDANGRGAPDPFNINDAALAAAHYLCVAGAPRPASAAPSWPTTTPTATWPRCWPSPAPTRWAFRWPTCR